MPFPSLGLFNFWKRKSQKPYIFQYAEQCLAWAEFSSSCQPPPARCRRWDTLPTEEHQQALPRVPSSLSWGAQRGKISLIWASCLRRTVKAAALAFQLPQGTNSRDRTEIRVCYPFFPKHTARKQKKKYFTEQMGRQRLESTVRKMSVRMW